MAKNIFQQQIVPDKPKVLAEERVYVYMPSARADKKGLASFEGRDFRSVDGHISLKWPMEMLVETLADPIVRPSLTKVLSDEFVKTNATVTVTNPVTGTSYQTDKAEIKLNRINRNALARPDLVMLSNNDFEATNTPDQYNSYSIRRKNALVEPTIVQVDNKDFKRTAANVVQVNWPYAHNPTAGSSHPDGYGLIKVIPGAASKLKYSATNTLEVDVDEVKLVLDPYMSARPTYGETNLTNWPTRNDFIDSVTGLAKRDVKGNTLLNFTKQSIGLSEVENRKFSTRTYDEFGAAMKTHFDTQFNSKLNRSVWDGPAGLFRDWEPPSVDRNTVQKWFLRLEREDESIWSSIRSMNLYLGIYPDEAYLNMAHPPTASILGGSAQVVATNTYWAIKPIDINRYQYIFRIATGGLEDITGQEIGDRAVNLNNREEHVWNGLIWASDGTHDEEWEWYDTTDTVPNFNAFVETDKNNLYPNAPIANVSLGISGKWIQSDHVHPSDPGKLDADVIEDSTITITTTAPTGNDFTMALTDINVLDQNGVPINATIVSRSEYLEGIPSPALNDMAYVRYTSYLYKYDGAVWQVQRNLVEGEWVYDIGSLSYDMSRQINMPYVRTAQYLHNWKDSPTLFTQGPNSNETYWAGSKTDYVNLDMNDVPVNTLFVIDENEEDILQPGYFVTEEQIEKAGLQVSFADEPSTERFVIIDQSSVLDGVPVTIRTEAAAGGKSARRVVDALSFGLATTSPSANHRMVITIDGVNGRTLGQRAFTPNRVMSTDENGNPEITDLIADNMLVTAVGEITTILPTGYLLKSADGNTVTPWGTGVIENAPLVSDGANDIKALILDGGRVLLTNPNGGLYGSDWASVNLVKTGTGPSAVTLTAGGLVVADDDNTITNWAGLANNAMVLGDTGGKLKTRTHTAVNRILITGADGTVSELGAGEVGQMLASNGPSAPGWVNAPAAYSHLPQTRLTTNPSELVASAYAGLVAVVSSTPIAPADMRTNCIYYL